MASLDAAGHSVSVPAWPVAMPAFEVPPPSRALTTARRPPEALPPPSRVLTTARHPPAALPRAHDGASPPLLSCALSAQVRRVLTMARNLGIRMEFTLTRLPAALRTPGTWLEFKGRSVQVRSDGTCVPVRRSRWTLGRWAPSWASKMAPYWARGRGEGACTPSEAQLTQTPPRLLSSLLLPYPAPLLEGDGTELHCSS